MKYITMLEDEFERDYIKREEYNSVMQVLTEKLIVISSFNEAMRILTPYDQLRFAKERQRYFDVCEPGESTRDAFERVKAQSKEIPE